MKYLVIGGTVPRVGKANRLYVTAYEVIEKYGLKRSQCIVAGTRELQSLKAGDKLVVLKPDPSGEYKLPCLSSSVGPSRCA